MSEQRDIKDGYEFRPVEQPVKNAALAAEIVARITAKGPCGQGDIQAVIDKRYPEKVQLVDGVLRPVPWGGAAAQEPRPDTDPDLGDVEKLARWALGAPEKDEEPTIGTTIARAFLSLLAAHDALKAKLAEATKGLKDEKFEHGMTWECLGMVRETLEANGCCHGHDGSGTPPMMYPEWINCVISHHAAKEKARVDALEQERDCLREALDELADLVEAAHRGEYEIDSLTTQPARAALRGEQEGEG